MKKKRLQLSLPSWIEYLLTEASLKNDIPVSEVAIAIFVAYFNGLGYTEADFLFEKKENIEVKPNDDTQLLG